MKKELKNFVKWFSTNKLSFEPRKNKVQLFHKSSKKDGIPLRLSLLSIDKTIIGRKSAIKFFGVILVKKVLLGEPILIHPKQKLLKALVYCVKEDSI